MTKKTIETPGILLPPEITDDFTRREFIVGAGLIALVPGCGSGEESSEQSSGETRAIEHKFGTTEVPGELRRVLSLGFNEHDFIFALGVEPIAIRYWYGDEDAVMRPWTEDEAGDVEPDILNMPIGELNFERIAALEPDLILGVYSGMTEDEYETLSEIAPTVAQSGEYPDFGMPWQEQALMVGKALGREVRAEELVAKVEARFEAVREAHPEFEGASVAVASYRNCAEIELYPSESVRIRFFTTLGFVFPEELAEIAEGAATISSERLDLLDTDILVWHQLLFTEGGRDTTEGGRDTIESEPLVQQLDAAKEGRMVFIEDIALDDALGYGTVLSLPFLLERMTPMLAAAIDGDPDTNAE